jgi:hypothetical protein
MTVAQDLPLKQEMIFRHHESENAMLPWYLTWLLSGDYQCFDIKGRREITFA